jgi:hypothetical protein
MRVFTGVIDWSPKTVGSATSWWCTFEFDRHQHRTTSFKFIAKDEKDQIFKQNVLCSNIIDCGEVDSDKSPYFKLDVSGIAD